MIIKLDNHFYKKYEKYISNNFPKFSKKKTKEFFETLLTQQKNKTLKLPEDMPEYFFTQNNSKLINKEINEENSNEIKFLFNKYLEDINNSIKAEIITNNDYNFLESEILEDGHEIKPTDKYDYICFLRNLSKNIYATHIFNEKIEISNKISSKNSIQCIIIRIDNFIDEDDLPIMKKVICNKCNNNVIFTSLDEANSSTKCTFNSNPDSEQGHPINLSKGISYKSKKIHGYVCSYLNEKDEWIEIKDPLYFLEEINLTYLKIQFIKFFTKKSTINLVLSYDNESAKKKLDKKIINKYSHNKYFFQDIIESDMFYLSKNHNLNLTKQNIIIGYLLLNSILFNTRFNLIFDILIIGLTGEGKSFWAKILSKLHIKNYTKTSGDVIRKNKYLGGHSLKKSFSGQQLIEKGWLGTKNMLIVEEISPSLNDYHDKRTSNIENYFVMHKHAKSDEEAGETTQGTRTYKIICTEYASGNYADLDKTKRYKELLIKEFKKIKQETGGDTHYEPEWPLFMPIEWYYENKNKELAKAHYIIRSQYDEYKDANIITGLKYAEMARWPVFLGISEDEQITEIKVNRGNKEFLDDIHVDQINEEINELIPKIDLKRLNPKTHEIYIKLKDQIINYLETDFFKKRQNFKIKKERLSTHIIDFIRDYSFALIVTQKHFYKKELKFIEEDKELIEYVLKFINNVMTPTQLSLEEEPYFNDYYIYDEVSELNKKYDDELSVQRRIDKQKEELKLMDGRLIEENELSSEPIEGKKEDLNVFKMMEE